MNNEFKKIKSNEETRYVLETATSGATSSGAVATSVGGVGKVQKRNPDNILAQEANKTEVPANKPRNFVAKNAKMGGAGAHKDKKKEQKQGKEKHRKPYMENVDNPEYNDEAGMAHSNLLTTARAVMGLLKTIKDRDNLPEWGQEKIAKAEMMLVSVWDYLQSQKEMGNNPQQGVAEGLRDPKDNPCWKGYKPVGTKKKGGRTVPNCVPKESTEESAPPGWEKTVKAMKKHDEIDNPYALAWSMKNKGYKSHKKESAVGEAVPTGNEADVRRKLIKYIARWKDWGISDLELAKTDELIDMYKECQKEKKDWLKRRSDWWNKGDELAKQKGINKLDALAQVPHDLDRDNAQGQFNFKEDAYTSSLFSQLEERTKK